MIRSPHRFLSFLSATLLVASVSACDGGGGDDAGPGDGDGDVGDGDGDTGDGDGDVGDGDGDGEYDAALLQTYKQALPTADTLQAPTPTPMMGAQAVGDPAQYPPWGIGVTTSINAQIRGIIDTLDAVTDVEPTVYNSETLEFVWGPWDNQDTPQDDDKVAVYIKDAGEDADFRYHYAFVRGVGNDLSTYTPVIFGGANPSPDDPDHGNGITLFDFEANAAFEDATNPDHDELPTGRFAAGYSRGPSDDDADVDVTIVMASFRNFSTPENDDPPANFDHLYGRILGPQGNTLDFINVAALASLYPEENDGSGLEILYLKMAFFNQGAGRGELLIGGDALFESDLPDADNNLKALGGVECWDGTHDRTFFTHFTIDLEDNFTPVGTEGEVADCGGPFVQTLEEAGVPDLEDFPADVRAAIQGLADNGIGG